MALLLSGNWRDELLRARLATNLSPAQIADLWPTDPPAAPATLPDLAAAYRRLPLGALAAAVPDFFPVASASNEWVVAGEHTASGKPLLANDPHLGFRAPGMWYLARIVTSELTITGATLPGQPFVMLGHNGHVAWGMTTTHADTQDLFVERLDPDRPDHYLAPGGARPFAVREESIRVRFRGAPETMRVRATRHGPVISDLASVGTDTVGASEVLALAFPALRPDDRTADAVARMNRARDWPAFRAALQRFGGPVQNIVYADTAGTIAFWAPGRVPRRAAGDGSRPAPGWTGTHDWTGFVAFDELPHAVNPPRGRIVNANNRIVGDTYPHLITADWPAPYRAARIEALLDADERPTADRFAAIQLDARTLDAADLLPLLLPAAGGAQHPLAAEAARLLAGWDAIMDRRAAAPLIYMGWLNALARRLYRDELGELFGAYRGMRPLVLQHMLSRATGWCDDTATPALETCDAIVAGALDDALAVLADRLGDDMADWRWGDLHRAQFAHPLFGRVPGLRTLATISVPSDGGPFTVNRGTAHLADGPALFSHVHGAGFRAIYDLADLRQSQFALASGQSGHPLSPHYGDTTLAWRDGAYFRLDVTRAELATEAVATLVLRPSP